jgi:hypothetical protein
MTNQKWIVVGVVLSLLFCVVPARAASRFVAASLLAPIENDRHRVKLPTGTVEYDYSFPATVRIVKPDGNEQIAPATCYIKAKKPPTKEQWENGVCAVALGGTVLLTCTDLEGICAAGGPAVFPVFCGGLATGCALAELGIAGLARQTSASRTRIPLRPRARTTSAGP